MPDILSSAASSYAPPVSQLLLLGEPRRNEQCDYTALGISSASAPDLIRMATDEQLNNGLRDSALVWAPVHAWRALGQLRVAEAVAPLLTLFQRIEDFDDDWVATDLPKTLAQIGAPAIASVADYLADATRSEWGRVAAAAALGHMGNVNPELRAVCVARLAWQLEKFADQPETVNTFVISALWDLHAVEALPVIEAAFASGRVDESVNGDFEDVQIHFGLKTKREHPPKPNSLTAMHGQMAGLREQIEDYEQENAELRETLEVLQAIASPDTKSSDPLDDSEFDSPPEPYIAPPKIGRNEPCPCGSGKKYKKCCGT